MVDSIADRILATELVDQDSRAVAFQGVEYNQAIMDFNYRMVQGLIRSNQGTAVSNNC